MLPEKDIYGGRRRLAGSPGCVHGFPAADDGRLRAGLPAAMTHRIQRPENSLVVQFVASYLVSGLWFLVSLFYSLIHDLFIAAENEVKRP